MEVESPRADVDGGELHPETSTAMDKIRPALKMDDLVCTSLPPCSSTSRAPNLTRTASRKKGRLPN